MVERRSNNETNYLWYRWPKCSFSTRGKLSRWRSKVTNFLIVEETEVESCKFCSKLRYVGTYKKHVFASSILLRKYTLHVLLKQPRNNCEDPRATMTRGWKIHFCESVLRKVLWKITSWQFQTWTKLRTKCVPVGDRSPTDDFTEKTWTFFATRCEIAATLSG